MILWIVATLVAYFIKGMTGFANTLIFETILAFGVNNVDITPVDLVLGYPANAIMTWKERKHIRFKIVWFPTLIMMITSIPGMLYLKNGDTSAIKVIFGIVIIALGLEMLVREMKQTKGNDSKLVLTIIGVMAGLICGLYGIGALLTAYMNRVTDDTHSFKGNICCVFSIMNTYRVIMYIILGIFTWESVKIALMLFPVMFIGLYAGMFCCKFMDEKLVKKIVIIMLMISGFALAITNVL